MTVEELVSINQMIGDISIDLRERDGRLIEELEIGLGMKPRETYPGWKLKTINKSINTYDNGRDYYTILLKKIPKAWRKLEVYDFSIGVSYRERSGSGLEHIYMQCHKRENFDRIERKTENSRELIGQMTLNI